MISQKNDRTFEVAKYLITDTGIQRSVVYRTVETEPCSHAKDAAFWKEVAVNVREQTIFELANIFDEMRDEETNADKARGIVACRDLLRSLI